MTHPAPPGERRVLIGAALVTLLFWLADIGVVKRLPWNALAVRVAWAGLIGGVAWALPHLERSTARAALAAVGAASGICFSALVALTGGTASPTFHWMLALPLTVAVVVQDEPWATAAAALTTVLGGLLILSGAGAGAAEMAQWAILGTGMSALAIYAASAYGSLREQKARLIAARADEQARRTHAEAAVQERDAFISIAAHELRTPLTSVSLSLQLLHRELQAELPRDGGTARVEGMQRQLKRLERLVENLLDGARLQRGPALTPEPVDVAALAAEVVGRFRDEAARAGVPITLAAQGAAAGVWDAFAVERILTNLISNALRHGGGKPVGVRVEGAPQAVRVAVEDGGPGVPEADRERIFERFHRTPAGGHGGGLGLGLWISRSLAQAMGGSLSVESAPGGGATFVLALPRP